ncbi:hypothetical protein [Mumia flava]|nr:hypothetical protein [Mumia flava]
MTRVEARAKHLLPLVEARAKRAIETRTQRRGPARGSAPFVVPAILD